VLHLVVTARHRRHVGLADSLSEHIEVLFHYFAGALLLKRMHVDYANDFTATLVIGAETFCDILEDITVLFIVAAEAWRIDYYYVNVSKTESICSGDYRVVLCYRGLAGIKKMEV
jgi:hypothetical protein